MIVHFQSGPLGATTGDTLWQAIGKAWEDAKHPRWPEGTPVDAGSGSGGGRFAPRQSPAGKSDPAVTVRDPSLSGTALQYAERIGYSINKLRELFALPGFRVDVGLDRFPNGELQFMVGIRRQGETGDHFDGTARMSLDIEEHTLHLNMMDIAPALQKGGFGMAAYNKVIRRFLRDKRVRTLTCYASPTIGIYAWAKAGFEYATPGMIEETNTRFRAWAKEKGLPAPHGGWPWFSSPHRFAVYALPGVKVSSAQLSNSDVKPGEYDVGKAFMLDARGHGPFWGIKKVR